VSDIRITVGGREFDCLQKVYKVGNQLVLGFAGSVAIGLEAVAQIGAALSRAPAGGSWDPTYIGESLPIGTRELFRLFPELERALGCHLILLSAHPTRNDGVAPWARCYVHRYYAPEFEPIEAPQAEIVSIGSGARVKVYTDALKALEKDMEMFKLEVGFPGGSGIGLMSSLSSLLGRVPQPGISGHLQICLVGRESVRIGHYSPQDAEPMPTLATSRQELDEYLKGFGIASSEGATC
jgi:hypothetical protein